MILDHTMTSVDINAYYETVDGDRTAFPSVAHEFAPDIVWC
jgi:hypothetical protein